MDFVATQKQYGIKETGTTVTVPDNSIARLMYYLNCCNSCLDVLESKLTQYRNYSYLSVDEKAAVVALSAILSPDELLNNCFIPVESGNPILRGSSNKFFELETATSVLGGTVRPSGVVMMEGKRVQVNKFMIVTRSWLESYFITPFQQESWRLQSVLESRQPTKQPARQIVTHKESFSDRDLTPNSREWKRDAYSDFCMRRGCGRKFSTFHRRHHCRRCGNIFCGRHCPVANQSHYTRYCVDCE